VKTASSKWLKSQSVSLGAFAWQRGYGCFSVGPSDLPALCEYINARNGPLSYYLSVTLYCCAVTHSTICLSLFLRIPRLKVEAKVSNVKINDVPMPNGSYRNYAFEFSVGGVDFNFAEGTFTDSETVTAPQHSATVITPKIPPETP